MPDFRQMAIAYALKYGIDPDLFVRQIEAESGFDPLARSNAGALGIAQFMPATAQGMGVDPLDPAQALDGAARLMARYLKQYGGDYATSLAAYNAGPGNVAKYGGIPPFAETQDYIAKVMGGQTQQRVRTIGKPREYWVNPTKKDSKGNPLQYTTKPSDSGAIHHTLVTYENGEIYDFTDDPNSSGVYVDTDRELAAAYKAAGGSWALTKRNGKTYRVNAATGETEDMPELPVEVDAKAPAQSEPKLVGRTWWKYEPNSGQPINVGEIPLTAAEKEAQDLDLAYKAAQTANLSAANVLAQDKFAWEQAKEIENRRHEIEKQRQADEAAMERQRLSEQANLFDTVTKNWRELLPRRVPQGMEYWPGAEPEGPLSVLYKQAGAQYNPVAGRVVPTSYNDEDMWKKALGMVGGKQNG